VTINRLHCGGYCDLSPRSVYNLIRYYWLTCT